MSTDDYSSIRPIQSLTIKGASSGIISMIIGIALSAFFGIKIPTEHVSMISDLIGSIPADWGTIVLAAAAMWARLAKWSFDKSALASKTFWLSLLAAVMSLLGVLGIDTAALSDFGTVLVTILGKYLPTIAFILSTIGAVRAKKAIEV